MSLPAFSVGELWGVINTTLSYAYPEVVVEGEVASFQINQDKWVFFDIKDQEATLSCFMPKYQLNVVLSDGMKIRAFVRPNVTKWGKFSLTVRAIELAGEGSAKKAFELLRLQLDTEGLFEQSRKRVIVDFPRSIALITSKQAAACSDFTTILGGRWPAVSVDILSVQVQGEKAIDQIVNALEYTNAHSGKYDTVVLTRGGGSLEDLQAFNSEKVVRAVHASKVPIIVAVGHENDTSLAEMAADLRASTPTDAAHKVAVSAAEQKAHIRTVFQNQLRLVDSVLAQNTEAVRTHVVVFGHTINAAKSQLSMYVHQQNSAISHQIALAQNLCKSSGVLLANLSPVAVLARGYAVASIDGKTLRDPAQITGTNTVRLQLQRGEITLVRKEP